MKAPIEIKASVLTAMMSDDRQEVRGLRSSIYNIVSLLGLSSFALTAFLLEKYPLKNPVSICLLADAFIIVFLWMFFFRYKIDLYHTRQGLKLRQELICSLDKDDMSDLDPFSNANKVVPDIKDTELKWFPILVTVGIIIKMIVLFQATRA